VQKINIEQTENALRLTQAKIELWQQKIATYKEKGKKERAWIGTYAIQANGHPTLEAVTREYQQAHKSHEDAESQLLELTLAELKCQAAILQAGLKEADSSIVLGGSAGLARQ
jgi:hypothetical protein